MAPSPELRGLEILAKEVVAPAVVASTALVGSVALAFEGARRFRVRKQREAIQRVAGVFNPEREYHKFDIEPLVQDPKELKRITAWYFEQVLRGFARHPSLIGFVKKGEMRDTVMARVSGEVARETNLPLLTVDSTKEATGKVAEMLASNVVLISDTTETGEELVRAAKNVRNIGAVVDTCVVYALDKSKFRQDLFEQEGISVKSFFTYSS